MMQRQLENEDQQVAFGKCLGQALAGRGRLHLEGELGAGKTTLARGILRAYGHQGAVKSPTYTLVEPYELDGVRVYHFDLYRISDPEELEFIGGRDLLADDSLSIIEWPARGAGWLPAPDLVALLEHCERGRRITVNAVSDHGRQVLAKLDTDCTGQATHSTDTKGAFAP